jgi:DNA-binding IclR family transcriptional regulator
MERLTERAEELLTAIREAGDWVTRSDIAEATGKNRLSPHDRQLLDTLADSGYIEREERPAGISMKYVYKAK